MLYFIYETTNLINNKKYRGLHRTINKNDTYLGSGIALNKAIKKYGKENFKREILEFCNSFEELLILERKWVDENWISRKDTYNMRIGGDCSIGRLLPLNAESKKKISETLKRKYKSGEIIPKRANLGKVSKTKGKKLEDIVGLEKAKKIKEILSEKQKNKHPTSEWKKDSEPWNKGKQGVQVSKTKGKKLEEIVGEEKSKRIKRKNESFKKRNTS